MSLAFQRIISATFSNGRGLGQHGDVFSNEHGYVFSNEHGYVFSNGRGLGNTLTLDEGTVGGDINASVPEPLAAR